MDRYSPGFKKQLEGVKTFEDRLVRDREERAPKNVAEGLQSELHCLVERFDQEAITHEHLAVLRTFVTESLPTEEEALTEWIEMTTLVAEAAKERLNTILAERKREAERVRLEAERIAKEEKEIKKREEVLRRQLIEMLGADWKWWRQGSEHLFPHLTCRTAGHLLDRRPPSGWHFGEERPWNRTEVEAWVREVEATLPSLEATRLVHRLSPEKEQWKRREWLRQREERRAALLARIPTLTREDLKLLSDEEVEDLQNAVDDAMESMNHRMRRYAREDAHHVITEYRRRERFRERIGDLLEHYEEHVEPRRERALNHEAHKAKWRGGRPGKHARRGHRCGSDTDPRREYRRDARRIRALDEAD